MANHQKVLLGISGQGDVKNSPTVEEGGTHTPAGGYTDTYTGGNKELDGLLAAADEKYNASIGNATDMRNAYDEYNQALNAYGYAADTSRNDEINSYVGGGSGGGLSGYGVGSGGGYGGYSSFSKTSGGANDYSEYIRQMHEAQKQANLAALENAYNKNVATLNRAARDVPLEYQNARNQTASQSAIQQKNFNEYAAARGLNTGTGAQAQLAFGNTLQSNLSGLNQQEAASMADLELQRAQLLADYNAAIAQAEAGANYELADALYNEKIRVDNAAMQMEQYNRALAEDRAATLAKYGDFSGYTALGYSDAEIKAMTDYYNAANAVSSMPRKTGGGNPVTNPNWDELFTAATQSGNPESYISNMYKQFGFTSTSGLYDDYLNWAEANAANVATDDKMIEIANAAAKMKSLGQVTTEQINAWLDALPYHFTAAQKEAIKMYYGG